MEPATNLRQDARQVAAIFNHFDTHTQPLLARLPVFQAGRAEAGRCIAAEASYMCTRGASTSRPSTVRGGASLHLPTTTSCAGSRASSRSAARPCALTFLPAGVQSLAMTSNDPCLREQATASRRAG
jgi:hypothetical protein